MKNVPVIGILLIALAMIAASCSSSRKYGCPGNPQANYRFRG
jgi:hypothetical protein